MVTCDDDRGGVSGGGEADGGVGADDGDEQ